MARTADIFDDPAKLLEQTLEGRRRMGLRLLHQLCDLVGRPVETTTRIGHDPRNKKVARVLDQRLGEALEIEPPLVHVTHQADQIRRIAPQQGFERPCDQGTVDDAEGLADQRPVERTISRVREDLLEERLGITHGALRFAGDRGQRGRIVFDALLLQDPT